MRLKIAKNENCYKETKQLQNMHIKKGEKKD